MAWNSDGTRMPWRMHSEYLQQLYLQNDLANGRFKVNGRPIDLKSIALPMVVFGTETDHVAPWKSTYKARGLTRSGDYTYVLTSGGHNAGIVCGPVHPRRRFPLPLRLPTWQNRLRHPLRSEVGVGHERVIEGGVCFARICGASFFRSAIASARPAHTASSSGSS